MANGSISVEGLNGVLEMLDNLVSTENIQGALEQSCALVEKTAKQKAPKDTGALRRSITSRVEENQGWVFTPLEYAPYIEFGTGLFAEGGGRSDVPWHYKDDKGEWRSTSGQKPQPFLRPALNEKRSQILTIFKNSLKGGK